MTDRPRPPPMGLGPRRKVEPRFAPAPSKPSPPPPAPERRVCPRCERPTSGPLFVSDDDVVHCGCRPAGVPGRVSFDRELGTPPAPPRGGAIRGAKPSGRPNPPTAPSAPPKPPPSIAARARAVVAEWHAAGGLSKGLEALIARALAAQVEACAQALDEQARVLRTGDLASVRASAEVAEFHAMILRQQFGVR